MSTGFVVGKFLPYHKGHKFLIDTAREAVDTLVVGICERRETNNIIPISKRLEWIRYYHPTAQVKIIQQDEIGLNDDDSPGWAEHTKKLLGYVPDYVFTSEKYGDPWAVALGSKHVLVDLARNTVPISATEIRANPLDHLRYLMPKVRAHYVKRVVLLGSESTGKSTLALDLAWHFQTRWVKEYGRTYTEIMPEPTEYIWTTKDFERIIEMQNWLEDEHAGYANKILICDTNSYVTTVFHDEYMGFHECGLDYRAKRHYDLYIICGTDIPFTQDGIRTRRAEMRERMHERYLNYVQDKPHVIVSGNRVERATQAVKAIELETGIWCPRSERQDRRDLVRDRLMVGRETLNLVI